MRVGKIEIIMGYKEKKVGKIEQRMLRRGKKRLVHGWVAQRVAGMKKDASKSLSCPSHPLSKPNFSPISTTLPLARSCVVTSLQFFPGE